MFFDWACIYSDDKVASNKGHQYRSGSLDLALSQHTELKNFFYIPSNFPKIAVISGKWFESINKMAIGATQILPIEGRTSYLTFIVFLSSDEIKTYSNILPLLKFIIQPSTILKDICDKTTLKKIPIEISFLPTEINIDLINKAKNFIFNICDNYSSKNSSHKVIVQDEIYSLDDYILLLSLIWSLSLPTIRKDFHWIGLIKYIDIPLENLTKFIFIDKVTQQWQYLFNEGKFNLSNKNIDNPLVSLYTKYIDNGIDDYEILSNYQGGLEDLYLLNSCCSYFGGLNSQHENTTKINIVLSLCSNMNQMLSQNILGKEFFEKQYISLQEKLSILISEVNDIAQVKRFFADKNCLINSENLISLDLKINSFINDGQKLDKAILAHAIKFEWVGSYISNIYNKININEIGVLKSFLSTILQNIGIDREKYFLNLFYNYKMNLFENIINFNFHTNELVLTQYLIFLDFFKKYEWNEFSTFFSIIYISANESIKKSEFLEVLENIDKLSLYDNKLIKIIKCMWGGAKFTNLFIESEDIKFLDKYSDFILENLELIKLANINKFIVELYVNLLPCMSIENKKNIFNQDYFDLILKFMLDEKLTTYIPTFLMHLQELKKLHLYNLNYKYRDLLWPLNGSKNYLRPTTIQCISIDKPIISLEDVLFNEINTYLVNCKITKINNYLILYLKDQRVIYSVNHDIVLNLLSSHMSPDEMRMYVSNMKCKKGGLKKIIDFFKEDNRSKFKKIRDYHRIVILDSMSFEEKLEVSFPNSLNDINIGFNQWKLSFQNCLINLINTRLELEVICSSSKINYKHFSNGDSLAEFISIIVNKVFDHNIVKPLFFIESIQSHLGIKSDYTYMDPYNNYKLFIMLKKYYITYFS